MFKDEITFTIPKVDLQSEAEKLIGRQLSEIEISEIKRRVELGISSGIDLIYKVAIFDSVGA